MLSKTDLTQVKLEIPTLETERLLLREFRLSDFDVFADLMADPVFRRYLGKGDPLNREEAWRTYCSIIGHWVLRGFGFWALEDKATGAYVGHVGIHYPEDWPDVEIGWGIHPDFQQGGYGFEAAQKVMQYGFNTLNLDYLISLIAEGNTASANLALKLGEKHTKTVEMFDTSVRIFKITKDEFLAKS